MTIDRRALKAYAGARVLVLGASGFIGRWVSRLITGEQADAALAVKAQAQAEQIFRQYGINGRVLTTDLADPTSVRSLVREVRPTIIFNLAGFGVDPEERGSEDEARYRPLNVQLVGILCEELSRLQPVPGWKGQRLVHAGTVFEYGPIGGDLAEDSQPRPHTVYGRTKLEGTLRLVEECRRSGLRGLTARLFQVYGPGEHVVRLLPMLLAARETGVLEELSRGTQPKDFTYVEDVAEGLLRLGLADATPGETVNLATGRLHTVREFTEEAARVLRLPPSILRFSKPVSDKELTHDPVAVGRLRNLVGWLPSTTLPQGIRRTVEFEDALSIGADHRDGQPTDSE